MMYLDLLHLLISPETLGAKLRRILLRSKQRLPRLPGIGKTTFAICVPFLFSLCSPLFAQGSGGSVTETPVFSLPGELEFNGTLGGHREFPHTSSLEIPEGTVTFSFIADRVSGSNALFS